MLYKTNKAIIVRKNDDVYEILNIYTENSEIEQILNENNEEIPDKNVIDRELGNADNKLILHTVFLRLTNILLKIGVPVHIKGYNYLRESIMMAVNNTDLLNYITKELYPAVAKKYNTAPNSVERAIRYAVKSVWKKENIKVIEDIFKISKLADRKKHTNSEFIALISDKLRLEFKFYN